MHHSTQIRRICTAAGAAVVLLVITAGSIQAQFKTAAAMRSDFAQYRRTLAPLDRAIRVSFDRVPLAEALRVIARESGVSIAFSDRLLPPNRRVTLHAESMATRGVLESILRGTGMIMEVVENGHVLVLPKSSAAFARVDGIIQGRVVDRAGGNPVANAEVRLLRSPAAPGVVTSGSGTYVIADVPAGTYWLKVSLLGFVADSQRVTVEDDEVTVANFSLAIDALKLDPLSATVSTGTLIDTERRRLGTSIAVITSAEIEESGATQIFDLLQGRVPGVTAFQPSGENGAGGHIRIRGVSSILGDQSPLIYVDGVPIDNGSSAANRAGEDVLAHPTVTNAGSGAHARLQEISLDQIERIEIVKGSAATTMYGTEAINGVIQIFTKRGIPGDFRITARTEQGVSSVNLSDSFVRLSPYSAQVRDLFKEPRTARYNVLVAGGERRLAYTLGVDHGRDAGVITGNDASETSVHGSFSTLGSDKVSLRLSASMLQRQYSTLDYSALFDFVEGGTEVPSPPGIATLQDALERGSRSETDVQRIIASANLTWRPISSIQNQFTVGVDRSDELQLTAGQPLRDAFSSTFQAENIRRDFNRLTGRYVGTLSMPAEGTITSTFSVGAEAYHSEIRHLRIRGIGLPSADISGLDFAENITSGAFAPLELYSAIASVGFFGQEQVGLWDKLFLTAGIRADGSSAFGDDFGLQVYPKMSASYVVEPAGWWAGKLRAAWGKSGKLPTAFAKVQTYTLGRGTYYDRPVISVSDFGNPDLKPEVGTELELGVENYFFGNRASVELNYWRQETEDALLRGTLPLIYGFNSPLVNIAALRSSGIELSGQVTPLQTDATTFSIGFTVTHMMENGLITDLGDVEERGRVGNLFLGMQVGQSINAITYTSQINNRRVFFGNREPKTYGGVSADFRWDRVRVATNLSYGAGGVALDHIQAQQDFTAGLIASSFRTYDPQVAEARYIVPTDFLRLDALRLSYDLPPTITRGVQDAQVWIQGRNLMTWDRWENGDATTVSPVGTAGGQAPLYISGTLERGFAAPRHYALGLRVSF